MRDAMFALARFAGVVARDPSKTPEENFAVLCDAVMALTVLPQGLSAQDLVKAQAAVEQLRSVASKR